MKTQIPVSLTFIATLLSSCMLREQCVVCEGETANAGVTTIIEVCDRPDDDFAQQIQDFESQGFVCTPSN